MSVTRLPTGSQAGPFERWYLPLVLLASTVLGVGYALFVPLGLPYDEPSHWNTVLHYAHHWSLPHLADAGVTYTAEHPPVPYYLAALFQHLAQWLGFSAGGQVIAIRFIFGLQLPASIFIFDRILRRLGFDLRACAMGLVLFGLSPINLAIFWSVQNDGLMILGTLGITLAVLRLRSNGSLGRFRSSAALGIVAGVLQLIKITAFWFVVALAFWLVWVIARDEDTRGHRVPGVRGGWIGRAASRMAMFWLWTGLACGWWFVLNLVRYGALTGDRAHAGIEPATGVGFTGVQTLWHAARSIVTYLWIPTEYWRNTVELSSILDLAVIAMSAVIGVAAARTLFIILRRPPSTDGRHCRAYRLSSPDLMLPALVVVVSVVGWFVLYVWVASFPARIGMTGLVMAGGVGGALSITGLGKQSARTIAVCVAAVLTFLDTYLLVLAHGQSYLSERLLPL